MQNMTKQFSRFRSAFLEAFRHTPSFEREYLTVVTDYTFQRASSSVESLEELDRDFAIFHSRFARLRHSLFVTHGKVIAAIAAFKFARSDADALEEAAYDAYGKWYQEKQDFEKSFCRARVKWDKMLKQE
jgi:hypothetical protein